MALGNRFKGDQVWAVRWEPEGGLFKATWEICPPAGTRVSVSWLEDLMQREAMGKVVLDVGVDRC